MTTPTGESARAAECSRTPAQGGASAPRFVLVETSHPGNIGSAARAIATMGFGRLILVRPERFPHAEATALAAGADDVLAAAEVVASLDEAVADCVGVYGTSARTRTLDWPRCDARAAALEASGASGPVAFVFGRERSGLTNRELDCCTAMITIPTGAGYGSLNLAQAVQIIAYELCVALQSPETAPGRAHAGEEMPTHAERERFYAHLEETLVDIGFLDPGQPKQLMRRLRRFFHRAAPSRVELNILRGVLRNAGNPEPGSPARARLQAARDGGEGATIPGEVDSSAPRQE